MRNCVDFRRRYPEFQHKPLVVATETNARYTGDMVREYLCNCSSRESSNLGELRFHSTKQPRTGIVKTHPITVRYIRRFDEAITAGAVRIHDKVGTMNERTKVETHLAKLKQELLRFVWFDSDSDNVTKRKITGKWRQESDDRAMVALMLVDINCERLKIEAIAQDYSNRQNRRLVRVRRGVVRM